MLRALLASAALAAATGAPAQAPGPTGVVQQLQDELARVAAEPGLDFQARRSALAGTVRDTHDLSHIARLVGGRHWRDWTPQQRERFLAVFEDLTVALYAGRFAGSGPLAFRPGGRTELPRGVVRVTTELAPAEGEAIGFEYLLHASDGGWRIINILVDGVSDLALRRSQYTTIAAEAGFEGLLVHIGDEIKDLADP